MTREEAIKVAYGIPVTKAQHEALRFLIPELRESEDERIREEMLNSLKEAEDSIVLTPFKKNSWIAYLEKQKEQKPAKWSAEDEKMLNVIIGNYRDNDLPAFESDRKDVIDWLKSLPKRFNLPLQPKVELEKEIRLYQMNHNIISHGENGLNMYMESVARHFYELGLNARKEK